MFKIELFNSENIKESYQDSDSVGAEVSASASGDTRGNGGDYMEGQSHVHHWGTS